MNRFFVKPENVGAGSIFIDNKEDLHHMMKVLRLSAGDEIEISDSAQWEYRAELISLDQDGAEAKILDKQKFSAEPSVRITLFQGIPKQGKMELIIQKCVELGVFDMVPVFMARTVVVDKGKFHKKIERWQKVSAEAVKQCKRGIIPRVKEPIKTREVIDRFGEFDLVLFPYENEEGTTIKDVLQEEKAGWSRIAVLIGPEGGFSDEEAAAIQAAGGRSVSLGKATLRTETAGMAALAMIQYELEL
ncbi:MAG: 16S rRNA (uracil(1498)-N(3))-methyltransferase [Bacillota bacterium]|nr:16S rRNA (uracil(1498)-N(3))-methyltransferase [Bacillota bacterium]